MGQCVLRCHGSNVATVKDIIDLRRFLREQSLKPLTAGDSVPSNMRSEGKLAPSSRTRSEEDQTGSDAPPWVRQLTEKMSTHTQLFSELKTDMQSVRDELAEIKARQ